VIWIKGHCPMGCGPTLFVGEGGYVTCSFNECPAPSAASDILADAETEHVVELRATDFSLKHPLRERIDGELFDCPAHEHLESLRRPPEVPGRYRMYIGPNGFYCYDRVVE
jgi:hypothetical protein